MMRLIFSLMLLLAAEMPQASQAAPQVIVTVRPVAAIVRELCATDCEVRAVMPPGQSEHTWEPSVRDVMRLSDADVAIGIGLDFDERWLKSIPFSKKIEPTYIGAAMDPRPSIAEKIPDEDHHHHGAFDPHVWFDPGRMSKGVDVIVGALAKAFPGAKDRFLKRGESVRKDLIALDAEIHSKSLKWSRGVVVVFHDNLRYFSARYDLKVESVIPGAAGHEVSAHMLAALTKKYKNTTKPKLMLTEREDGSARNIARELGVPLEVADFAAITDTMSYEEWMRSLAQIFDHALRS